MEENQSKEGWLFNPEVEGLEGAERSRGRRAGLWQRLGYGRKSVVGIEVGSSELRLIEADMDSLPLTLRRIVRVETLSPDPENIARQIRGLLQQNEIKSDFGALSLSGPEVIHRVLEIPLMPRSEMRAVVEREVLRESRQASGPMAHGWYPIGEVEEAGVKKVRVLVVIAPKSLVEGAEELLRLCGFKRWLITSTPLALLQSIRAFYFGAGGVVGLMHIGESMGYLLFARHGSWGFCQEFPLHPPPLLDQLTLELKRGQHFYRQKFPAGRIEGIIISGKRSERLKPAIEGQLDLELEVFDPARNLDLSQLRNVEKEDFSSFASLLGLVSESPRRAEINLATPAPSPWLDSRVQGAVAAGLSIAVAGLLLFQSIAVSKEVGTLRSRLNQKRQELGALQTALKQAEEQKALAALAQELARFRGQQGDASSLLPVFQYLSMIVPDEMVFTSLTFIPAGDRWEIRIKGQVIAAEFYRAQTVFNQFYLNLVSSLLLESVELPPFSVSVVDAKGALRRPDQGQQEVGEKKSKIDFEVSLKTRTV
ncbi:MAG: hypothetical protein HYY46_10840 [Deltaproteobacteria bacterium]|nr:hypothetical protein [Deltaproteobacteria bacterium]